MVLSLVNDVPLRNMQKGAFDVQSTVYGDSALMVLKQNIVKQRFLIAKLDYGISLTKCTFKISKRIQICLIE